MALWAHTHRGFESHPLRQYSSQPSHLLSWKVLELQVGNPQEPPAAHILLTKPRTTVTACFVVSIDIPVIAQMLVLNLENGVTDETS